MEINEVEEKSVPNPTEYCRTCMERSSTSTCFTSLFNVPFLAEMLTSCASVQVHIDDGLPEQLCSPCLETLTAAYEFKRRCERSDEELRKVFLCNITKSEALNIKIKQEPIEVKTEYFYDNNNDCNDDDFRDSDDEPLGAIELKVKKKRNRLPKKIHQCHICQKIFPKNSKLLRHVQIHNKEINNIKEHPCPICQRVFDRASKLERHIKIHNPELKPHGCMHCEKRFKSESLLLTHLVTHQTSANGENVADSGEGGVAMKQEHDGQIKDELKTEKYPCEQCDKFFYTSHSLSAHMRKHRVKNRILACSICGKVFKKSSHLKRHEKTHEDNRPFKCTQCTKSFALERQLVEHINKHKGVKPHQCPVCSKAFAQTSTLNAHLRVHTREKPYLCATCGKRFDSSTNLNQHLKRHRGEKTFYCTLCPGRYVSKGELQSHMSTHTGARPFVCDTCGSAFTKTNSLAKHKLIHLGIKPHECDVCAMRFNSKDHLKRHYRIHTGEKPYKCEFCERAFTQSNDLVKHTRSHLGDKMYRCTFCSESFRLKTELRKHVSTHFAKPQTGSSTNTQQQIASRVNLVNKSSVTSTSEVLGESSNSFTDSVSLHFTNNKQDGQAGSGASFPDKNVKEHNIKMESLDIDYTETTSGAENVTNMDS